MQTKLIQLMAALASASDFGRFSSHRPKNFQRAAKRANQDEDQRTAAINAAKEKRLRREARNRKVSGHE